MSETTQRSEFSHMPISRIVEELRARAERASAAVVDMAPEGSPEQRNNLSDAQSVLLAQLQIFDDAIRALDTRSISRPELENLLLSMGDLHHDLINATDIQPAIELTARSVEALIRTNQRLMSHRLNDVIDIRKSDAVQAIDQARQIAVSRAERELSHAYAEISERLEATASLLESKMSALNERVENLSRVTDRADSVLATIESNAQQSEEGRRTQFNISLANLNTGVRTQLEEFHDRAFITLEQVKSVVKDIESQRDLAMNVVDVITVSATGDQFQKEAERQGKQANAWRWGALALGVAAAGVAVIGYIIGLKSKEPLTTAELIQHLSLGAILLGLAGYAAKQSGEHRRREEEARKFQLDLAAFAPFIQRLPEDEQNAARLDLIQKVFGRPVGPHNGKADAVIGSGEISLLSKLLDSLAKMTKP